MALRREPSRARLAANRARLVVERSHERWRVILLLVLFGPLLLACFALVVVVAALCRCLGGADRRAAERAGDTICTFARAFPRRGVDTLVLRAMWEGAKRAAGMPLCADDRLADVLEDPDLDLDWDELAAECGRTMRDHEANPYYELVETVRDAVYFLDAQPRVSGALLPS